MGADLCKQMLSGIVNRALLETPEHSCVNFILRVALEKRSTNKNIGVKGTFTALYSITF